MTPARLTFRDKPTLTGSRVTLRPVQAEDAPGLMELTADPEVGRLTGSRLNGYTLQQAAQWYESRAEHDDRLDLAILSRADGDYVGEAVLNDLDADNLCCNFRIALVGPRAFGRGYGSEATALILAHAFDTVGLNRVELEVYAFNPRAQRVYEKAGFQLEGVRRQALLWDGAWIDGWQMAIHAEDWRVRRRP